MKSMTGNRHALVGVFRHIESCGDIKCEYVLKRFYKDEVSW